MDPADVIRTEGAGQWKKIIDGAQHIVLFYLSVLAESQLTEHTRMRAVRDKILPYIAVMPSAVERVHFIREIHLKTGIPEEALAEDVIRLMSNAEYIPRPAPTAAPQSREASRTTRIEERLFGILLWQEQLSPAHIDTEAVRKRLKEIIGEARFKELYESAEEKKQERIFEVESLYEDPVRLARDAEELLDNLEEESLGRELEELMAKMTEAERSEGSTSIADILEKSQAITNRLNTIKNSRFKN